MKNKTLAYWLFISLGIAGFTAMIEDYVTIDSASILYTIAGLGIMVFGIWAGIRLFKIDNK